MKDNAINERIFLISYIFILSSLMFERVMVLGKICSYLEYIGFLLLFIIFLRSSYKFNEVIKILIILSFTIISAYISKSLMIFRLFIMVIAAKDISFNKIIKFDFIYRFIFLIIVLLFFLLGMTNNYEILRGETIRSSMGFTHPNVFGFIVLILNMEYVYLHNGNVNYKTILIGLISFFTIYCFADSRASFLILLFFYLFIILAKISKYKILNNFIVKKIIPYSFLIFTLITAIFTYLYINNYSIGIKVNELLSSRLHCIKIFLNDYSINFLGNNLLLVSTENSQLLGIPSRVLDNAYFHLLLRYGIFIFGIFALFFRRLFKQLFEEKNFILIIILFTLLIYGLIETYLFKVNYNAFLLLFSSIIFHRELKGVTKNEYN